MADLNEADREAATVEAVDDRLHRAAFVEFWFYFRENRGAVVGLVVFSLLVLAAVFAPLIAPFPPSEQYRDALLVPPPWAGGMRPEFLLGTDAVGRDILSRLIFGARFSLFIGVVVVVVALAGGVLVGLVAGYFRGWLETMIMRLMDIILALPSLLLERVGGKRSRRDHGRQGATDGMGRGRRPRG